MRTTLDIDPDVLQAAKAIAQHRRQSLGRVISDAVRKSIFPGPSPSVRNGLRVIVRDASAAPVTLEIVNSLRDEI